MSSIPNALLNKIPLKYTLRSLSVTCLKVKLVVITLSLCPGHFCLLNFKENARNWFKATKKACEFFYLVLSFNHTRVNVEAFFMRQFADDRVITVEQTVTPGCRQRHC